MQCDTHTKGLHPATHKPLEFDFTAAGDLLDWENMRQREAEAKGTRKQRCYMFELSNFERDAQGVMLDPGPNIPVLIDARRSGNTMR